MDNWTMYLVKHPLGNFIGFARTLADAREHFGTRAEIVHADENMIAQMRADGKEPKVFIAI